MKVRGQTTAFRATTAHALTLNGDPACLLAGSAYRLVMRNWPSGVSVIASEKDGLPVGCTVSAFTSVSADPPLILICLDTRNRTCVAVSASTRFSVNVLCSDQAAIAELFATPGVVDRFQTVPHSIQHGVPVLDGTVSYLICDVVDVVSAGDHTIFIAKPIDGSPGDGTKTPLIYVAQSWSRPVDLPSVLDVNR